MRIADTSGGVTDASVTYFLGRLGGVDVDVTVFESGHIAGDNGSTAYSAGLIRNTFSTALPVTTAHRGASSCTTLRSTPDRIVVSTRRPP